MKITIGHLYPDLLNLYGDRGNIQCLMKRCLWRGIEAETIAFELGDKIDFSKLDIVLLGGGSDRADMRVSPHPAFHRSFCWAFNQSPIESYLNCRQFCGSTQIIDFRQLLFCYG